MASHPQRRFDTADGAAGEPPQGLVAMLVGPCLESLHLLPGRQPAVRLSHLCRKRKSKRRPVRENPCRVRRNAPHGQKQGRCAADMTNVRNKLVGLCLLFSGKADLQSRYERCVLCGKITDVPLSLPIDLRDYYVEGSGQLCRGCWQHVCGR